MFMTEKGKMIVIVLLSINIILTLISILIK
nr:MAG TPA: hypothetical protein [Caudoviricetes sp.]DAI93756.1 MAG TPA: hypothetical protein [Caudoviricetes sp.]